MVIVDPLMPSVELEPTGILSFFNNSSKTGSVPDCVKSGDTVTPESPPPLPNETGEGLSLAVQPAA